MFDPLPYHSAINYVKIIPSFKKNMWQFNLWWWWEKRVKSCGEGGVDYYLLALNPTLLYPPMLSIFSMGGAVGWASWLLGSSITSSLGISPENLGTDPAGGGAPPVNQSIINLSITSFQLIIIHLIIQYLKLHVNQLV